MMARMTVDEAITRTLAMKGARGQMQEWQAPARQEEVHYCTHCLGTFFWRTVDGDLSCKTCGTVVYLS